MKKIEYRSLTPMTAAVLTTGCAGLGPSGGVKPTESNVMIEKDGSVRWQSAETYEAGDHIEEEMTAFLEQRISDYNSSLGKAASSRNPGGEQKLPVALVLVSLESGKTYSVTEYDAANRLVGFAQEIGGYNVAFSALESGKAAVTGQQMEGVSFLGERGKAASSATVLSDEQRVIVRTEGPGITKAEKKIMHVSKGCELRDPSTAKTLEEGTSFIVIN